MKEKGILGSVVRSFSGGILESNYGSAEITANNPAQKYNMRFTQNVFIECHCARRSCFHFEDFS